MSSFSGAATVYSVAIAPVLSKVDSVAAQVNRDFVHVDKHTAGKEGKSTERL